MKTPTDFSGSGTASQRTPARSSEKSNFSHTCSLLSRYLKERGSFGDLSCGMTCNLEGNAQSKTFRPSTTLNLLPKIEVLGNGTDSKPDVSEIKSMDLFPQRVGFRPSEDAKNSTDAGIKAEPQKAQMTIFYRGKVHVFNDFPSDKAREIMLMAGSGAQHQARRNLTPSHGHSASFLSTSCGNPSQASASDLPIARKASLHRFLEKRKERVNSKAPYKLEKE